MNVEERDISSLTIPEYCKRHHSKSQISKCVSSLKKHGQYQPIVVSENEILCGVLVYKSLVSMKRDKIWVNDLGPLTEERKKEIRYLDNQIFDIEDWDEDRIKTMLMNLDTSKLDDFGFTTEEAEQFINDDPGEDQKKEKKVGTIWECESCGWSGKLEDGGGE